MNTHKQLTKEQRYQIAALKKARHNNKTIASLVGVSESTISREIKRNSGKRGYRPEQAHQKALYRKRQATKAIKMTASAIQQPYSLWSKPRTSLRLAKTRT